MKENLLKYYKQIKIFQLFILVFFTGLFLFVFLHYPYIRLYILANNPLLFVFGTTWGILVFSFIFMFYDFNKMKLLTKQEHALKKVAYLDDLTGIPNRNGFDTVFKMYTSSSELENLGCALLSIKNLVEINETAGHDIGDHIIKNVCTLLETIGDKYGFIGRNGGNEFLAVFDNCDKTKMEAFLSDINAAIAEINEKEKDYPAVSFSSWYVLNQDANVKRFTDLVTLTYKKSLFDKNK